ncbi:hypothetical protein Dimus_005230 [Dionaea muscipula]
MALCAPSMSWSYEMMPMQGFTLIVHKRSDCLLRWSYSLPRMLLCYPQLCNMKLLEAGRRVRHEAAMKLVVRGSTARSQGLLPASHTLHEALPLAAGSLLAERKAGRAAAVCYLAR